MSDGPGPEVSRDGTVVVVSSRRIVPTAMLTAAKFPMLWHTVGEVMADVPDSDFIEISAVRFDKQEPLEGASA